MKKDIEWLTERVLTKLKSAELNVKAHEGVLADDFESRAIAYKKVLKDINQLDEPEVLSQEWIDEHAQGGEDEYILIDDLEGKLVPKQELPVIPKFVDEWIESRKNNYPSDVIGAYLRMNEPFANEQTREVLSWVHESKLNRGNFARAWLYGLTVEEEQKYQVIIRDGEYMRLYLCKHDGNVTIGTNDNYIEKCPEVTYLTEQEIKDYDERYFAFAVKVEELEE